jgi:hypothetical protein
MYGPTQTKTPTIFRTMKSPSKTMINMENLVLVTVFSTVVDKNGVAIRCGKTADFIDAEGVLNQGEIISTYNEDLFDKFVVGLQIAPRA